jgi:hypothetical protein
VLTRALIIGAMLAAMHLAAMTAVPHAHASDQQATRRPTTERQVGESWRHRQAAFQDQSAADATLQRVLARERFSIPNATSAEAPVPPKPRGQPGRLIAWLGVLVAALVLAGGLAVMAAKRPAAESGPGRRPDDPIICAESDGAAAPTRQPHHPVGSHGVARTAPTSAAGRTHGGFGAKALVTLLAGLAVGPADPTPPYPTSPMERDRWAQDSC